MLHKRDMEIMLDCAPVSTIALIGTPSTIKSTYNALPTVPLKGLVGFIALFELEYVHVQKSSPKRYNFATRAGMGLKLGPFISSH